jgi:hypothetical protein
MEIILEVCTTEEKRYFVGFCGQNNSMQRTFIKKCFMFTVCKAIHNLVEKRGNRFADDEEAETEMRKWLKQQLKDFYAADFNALVKRWDKCIIVGGGYIEKQMVLPDSNIKCFAFYIHL